MFAQIGISLGITVAFIMGTIDFNGEHVSTRNWSNFPAEQTNSSSRLDSQFAFSV
jgi:hypothetical protein